MLCLSNQKRSCIIHLNIIVHSALKDKTDRGRHALLAYADALMSTVDAYRVKPDEYISLECVKAALRENQLDLVSHWMAQNRCVYNTPIKNG